MTWYYKKQGTHIHVKVYCNGALCGNLCFRESEFINIQSNCSSLINFVEDV